MEKNNKIDFENKYNELIEIKNKLNDSRTDFSEALKLYSKAINIANECVKYLEEVKGEFNELKKVAENVELIERDESDFIKD